MGSPTGGAKILQNMVFDQISHNGSAGSVSHSYTLHERVLLRKALRIDVFKHYQKAVEDAFHTILVWSCLFLEFLWYNQ